MDECEQPKNLWKQGVFVAMYGRSWLGRDQAVAVFAYQALTIVMFVTIILVYFGYAEYNLLIKILVGDTLTSGVGYHVEPG